ncbi:MAG: S24 family peptidase [Candidatus Binataceae bacterium]
MSTTVEEQRFRMRLALIMRRFDSVAELARGIGVSDNAIYKWTSGRGQPSVLNLVALAQAAQVSVEWLATGRESGGIGARPHLNGDYAFPPRGKIRGRGRGAAVKSDQLVDYLAFNSDWLSRHLGAARPGGLILLEIIGDSMAPTLTEGDLALADADQRRIGHDGLFVLRDDHELMVKRLQRRRLDGALMIRSDNPAYSPIVAPAAQIDVVARVIWAGGRL